MTLGCMDQICLSLAKAIRPELTPSLEQAASHVLHTAASQTEPPAELPSFDSELHFAYAYTHTPERMLEWPERSLKEGDYGRLPQIWWRTMSSVRKTERFKTLVREAGLANYWKARGWPDLCRPMGADDFVCDRGNGMGYLFAELKRRHRVRCLAWSFLPLHLP